ncbi:MAG: ATP-binding cassette subfamily B protein [Myxococcota bacterium]|jgi:ATP-binding cassette subfamily B protein
MSENKNTTRRLLSLALPEAPLLTVATVALLISSGMSLVYPQAIKWLVDTIVADGDASMLNYAAIALVVMFIIQAVFGAVRAWLFTVASERVVARLRNRLFMSILSQEIGFFDKSRTGELTNRLASDTTVLQNTVTVNVSMGLRYIVGAVGGTVMLLWMSPRLTVVAIAVVPLIAISAAVYGRWLRSLSRKVQDALALSASIAEEAISGVRTVRAFAREEQEGARYAQAVDTSYQLAARRALAMGIFQSVLGFAGFATIALVVWWGGSLVIEDRMTVGDLTAFLIYTGLVAVSLGALSGLYSDFMRAIGASQRVFDLMDRNSDLETKDGEILDSVSGDVVLTNVEFAYPTRPDAPVLRGLNLTLAAGDVVALVGPSGSGKSTVAALLSRFYDPDSGGISIDGRDLTTLQPSSLRHHVGVVSQEPILFAATIAENIRYGKPTASEGEVRSAALAANALDFVDGFPEGFETLVGERGVRLSGGQKQRIAIARAVLKDPAILVLDEATSALDSESEHLVQEALDRLMEGRTTLVIAHRLSTVRDADRVVVLADGQVAEQGTHDALIEADGLYKRLVERQFGGAA